MCSKIYSAYIWFIWKWKKKHDSDEEKEKMQKKTTFENDSDDTIPEGVSKLKSFSMTILTVAVGNLLFTLSHLSLD